MATSLPSQAGPYWRTHWFAATVLLLVALALQLATDFTGPLERRIYDLASTTTARQPSDQVVIIAIDEQSLASLGPWPWPHDLHANLIDRLAAAPAKVIVDTALLFAPQDDRGLGFIRQIKDLLTREADPTSAPTAGLSQPLADLLATAESELNTDSRLADSLKKAGNVIIPSPAMAGQPARAGLTGAGVGHLDFSPDVDGTVRHETLMLNGEGQARPSLALMAVARSLDLTEADIRVMAGESVRVGPLRIKTDATGRTLPQFYPRRGGRAPFEVDSFAAVLSGQIPVGKYANKIVVIGVTAAGVGQHFAVPGYPALSPAQGVAHNISSILRQHFVVQPRWGGWAAWLIVLLVAGYLIAVLPRLSTAMAALITGLCLLALVGGEFALMSVMGVWLQLTFAATLLVIGHLILMIRPCLLAPAPTLAKNEAPSVTKRMLGLALQGQGQLDLAFEQFRQVPMGPAIVGDLQRLALDFQRKGQSSQAAAVQQHLAAYLPHEPDIQDPKTPLNPTRAPVPDGATGMLGRYQLERELGRGAMGAVYLGKDPKIGRIVAIKTLALSAEFDGAALQDVRERFFREAQTAGRLQHPNIVTIFDAGEERDLAYIAMEFLPGHDLVNFCKPGQLLPVPTVLSIVAQVAEALAYAHQQQVVHRDIKPANIMVDLAHDSVKVTDFGIARITDASKTRTGLVLGTPSFMSPEQLAGHKVDGRSDLYSLGVMLFQLLTGVLPFRAESLAGLMHKITHDEAPDLCSLRAELPLALANLVALALRKRPQDRYQDGAQFAQDLRALISSGHPIDLEL